VAGSAKVSEVNEAVAIPADGQLQSQDGRRWDIGDWESTSKVGEIAKVKAELIPCLPAKPVAAKSTEAPKTAEAPKASEPIERPYVGQQVVLSAKGQRNKELRKFLGGQQHAIIEEVRRDASIWITRPYLPGEDSPRTAGRQTVLADEIAPVERDYYLVPVGAIIWKGDEWWERDAWRPASCSAGLKKLIPAPLRRRKPTSLSGHSVEPNEFVKVLGPSRELESALYWNPIMSNTIGKVFCVGELVPFGNGLAIRIHDERSYEWNIDYWTLAYDWVSRPTESEIEAYQDSLAKVGNIVLCSSFDGKGRFYRICEVCGGSLGLDVSVLVESETLVRHHTSPRALLRLATKDEALKFTADQDDLRKAQAQAKPEAPKPSSQCPAEPGEGYRFLGPKELVVEGDEFWGWTASGDYGWEPTCNHRHGGEQGVGFKYRRRNKFTEGELVMIVKPLDTTVGPGWISSFDRWINENKVLTITELTPSNNYLVAETYWYFAPNWLAPASKEQKAQKEKEEEAKKAQIAELEGKMKDIQSQLDFLRK
jgi:hypothetical protein